MSTHPRLASCANLARRTRSSLPPRKSKTSRLPRLYSSSRPACTLPACPLRRVHPQTRGRRDRRLVSADIKHIIIIIATHLIIITTIIMIRSAPPLVSNHLVKRLLAFPTACCSGYLHLRPSNLPQIAASLQSTSPKAIIFQTQRCRRPEIHVAQLFAHHCKPLGSGRARWLRAVFGGLRWLTAHTAAVVVRTTITYCDTGTSS
jgi:hypothetical protein